MPKDWAVSVFSTKSMDIRFTARSAVETCVMKMIEICKRLHLKCK